MNKKVPFKCTSCGKVVHLTLGQLRDIEPRVFSIGMAGPINLDCPKCGNKTLTPAVTCPKCEEVVVIQMDPSKPTFDDKCPKCGASYAAAWQEKYRKPTTQPAE